MTREVQQRVVRPRREGAAEPAASVGVPVPTRLRAAAATHAFAVALGLTALLGAVVRTLIVLRTDFPLNDGGLFYLMTEELQRSGFRLPALTTYNGESIPFGYPPLAFYVAAALDAVTPLSLVDVFRYLPLVVTSLTVPAFALLARRILRSPVAVVAATAAFALAPRSFIWLIMGGGLTRSFGFLFAILALHQAHALYTTRRWPAAAATALFCSLTILSHVGTAPFVAFSIAMLFVAYGRHLHGVVSSAVVAASTVVLTAPWWGTVLRTHGVAPIVAASATGGSIFTDSAVRYHTKLLLLRLGNGMTSEPWFPVIFTLALAGAGLALVWRRFLLLPVWWLAIILLEPRARMTYSMVPVSMLAGIAASALLVRLLADRTPDPLGAGRLGPVPWRPPVPPVGGRDRWARLFPAASVAALVGYCAFAAQTTRPDVAGESWVLESLTPADRDAMRWVREHTPPSSRFAVVTGKLGMWANDRHAEWFPVLAARPSVGTVQGSEWLAGGQFAARIEAADSLQDCRTRGVSCVERWASRRGERITHVYIPRPRDARAQCCRLLLESLRADGRYAPVYDGPGALVFAAPAPTGTR